jgi:hypothetical protein
MRTADDFPQLLLRLKSRLAPAVPGSEAARGGLAAGGGPCSIT